MSNVDRILRGGVTLFASQLAIQFLSFLRNMIIARLLFPEDFGIASTFAVTTTALELMSDFSLGKAIVRDKNGDDPLYQSTVVTFSLVRGVLLAVLLYFSAGWLANLFGIPEAKFAYQILSVSPLIRAFIHMDMYRVQRKMDFSVEIMAHLASQIIGLIVGVVVAYLTRDYIAMLWGVIFQTTALVLTTHYMAERKYEIKPNRDYMMSALQFGWPIMINGIVLMLATQADRFLVGSELGMLELAHYAVVMMLVAMPSGMLTRVISSLTLPLMSDVQNDQGGFQWRYDLMGHVTSVMAVGVFVPLILLGTDLISLFFGDAYVSSVLLLGWASIAGAIRFMRTRMVNAFLAFANTQSLMYAEGMRVSGIIMAFVALKMGGGLVSVGVALTLGEAVAFMLCIYQLRRGKPIPIDTGLGSYGYALGAMGLGLIALSVWTDSLAIRFFLACLIPLVYVVASLYFNDKLREYSQTMIAQVRRFLPAGGR